MKTSMRVPRSGSEPRDKVPPRRASSSDYTRRYPIGAELVPSGGVHFRVWAPKCKKVALQLARNTKWSANGSETFKLNPEETGYFSAHVPDAQAGMLYKFKLD